MLITKIALVWYFRMGVIFGTFLYFKVFSLAHVYWRGMLYSDMLLCIRRSFLTAKFTLIVRRWLVMGRILSEGEN